jgi:pimeloyl-ACP methyl ester carboxylesterase
MLIAGQALLVLMFAGIAGSGEPKHGDFGTETVRVGDAKREYRLVVPKTVDLAKPAGPLGLQTLLGVSADRKFPALIIHGALDRIFPVVIARENRDKYRREGHEVKYVELKNVGHMWGAKADINETIWKFFDDHPLEKKYEPTGRDQH